MLTPTDFLRELHRRGASRIDCVRFRDNRSTIWSLTRGGTVLNVHAAYREATPALLDAFATLATARSTRSRAWREATEKVRSWPRLEAALADVRRRHAELGAATDAGTPTRCCGSPGQRQYLRSLYDYFNATRFGGSLPRVPVRLSNRMRSALGHMLPGPDVDGSRTVAEIAMNVDLMLAGNGAERVDTLLHEMAHVADYLESGNRGHGPSWRAWAVHAGCRPTTLYDRPVRFRRRRADVVLRVPPLPSALASSSAAQRSHDSV
jgi:hypothetical protein